MPPVDSDPKNQKKEGDNTNDRKTTTDSSTRADEKMRSEVSDPSNRNLWKLIVEKNSSSLPKVALEGYSPDATFATAPTDAAPKALPPKLDEETVKRYAQELHKAVNKQSDGFIGIGGGNDPDNGKIKDLLDSLTAADRKAIEDAYVNTDGNTDHRSLREELKDRLDGDDWRKAESILNRRDGRTNDAGNLMVALSAINDDRGDAERRVLETFSTLNSEQQKQLEEDFKHDYGMTVDEALKKYDMSGDALKAVGFLRKPVDERTAKDIEDFAHFAIDKKNLDYFGIALRGDTPAAKEARETLSKDEDFKKQISEAFKVHKDGGALGFVKNVVSSIPGGDFVVGGFNLVEGLAKGDLDFDRLTEGTTIDKLRGAVESKEVDSKLLQAMDILHSGHVSLATIAADNTGSIFGWFDNKKAIGNAADNATDGERELFSKGYEIAKNGGEPKNDDEKNALNFYNSIHKAFDDAGDDKESAKWQDKLLNGHGGSVITSVADADGKNARFAAVEGLSEADWKKLKDEKTGPAFRKELDEYFNKITDKDESKDLLDLIDKKVKADSYEDSQKVNRTLFQVIEQNKGHAFLMFGTDYDGKNVTAAIANLSADESAKYKNEASFRADVDKFVDENLDGAEKAYAKRLLSQVNETGAPPKQDAVDKLLSDNINKVEAKDAMGNVEAVLKDEKLRARLSKGEDLTEEEKQIKSTIDSYVTGAVFAKYGPAAGEGGAYADTDKYLKTIYESGRLNVEQKAELGLRTKDFFIDAATASADERKKLYDSGLVNDDDKRLIDTLVKQGGKMDLADEIRSFVLKDGTDVEQFGDKLKALSPEQKQQLRDEYTKKFGSTIDDDLLSRVDADDRNNFRTYLTATNVDGRQDFYDNLERALKSESGYSPDGSQEVLDRSLTDQAALLTDFQAKFEQLPADKQELANKYFSEALKDYKESKEQFAEKLYQVAVIVGGIAVGVATGGVGLAALAAVAVVGAVGRVALKKAIQGEDYDLSLSNVLKDGAIGAITAGASVIGPETIGAFAGVGRVAAERFAVTAGEELVEQGLKKGGQEIVEKEVNNLISHAVVRGEPISEQAIAQVIDKAAAEGISPAQRAALESALKQSIEDGGKQVSEQVIKSTLAGTARQAAVYGTIGGTTNVAIEGGVGLVNGNLDISSLPKAFAEGFAVGSTLSVGFEALSHGAAKFKSGGADIPAGTSEHLDLNFKKGEDGSITVTAPEGKDIDLTVKVNGQEQTIHVDSNGAKLPDGASDIGIKNAEITNPKIKTLDPNGEVVPVRNDNPTPAPPEGAQAGPARNENLFEKFKRFLLGSPAEVPAEPINFGRLQDTRVRIAGEDVPVNNGTVEIGRGSMKIDDPRVSRNQGTLRWNESDRSFYYTDNSTNGTYVQNGDHFDRIPKGQEVKLNPDQEVRLGSPDGPKLEFFNMNHSGPVSNLDRQVFVNGNPMQLENGRIEVGRAHQSYGTSDVVTNRISNDHGSVTVNERGQYVYTDHSKNGTYIKHANGKIERIQGKSVVVNPADEIHLGFEDGPVVKLRETPGRQLSDGSMLFRRTDGDWITTQDGTKILDDRAGTRVTFDKDNRITKMESAYGIKTDFAYGQDGQLNSVKFKDGSSWTSNDGTNWKIRDAQGNETNYTGKIAVDSPGSFRFEDSTTGKVTVRYPDGSEELHFPGRQTAYRHADVAIETQKLESLARYNFPDAAQAERFSTLMRRFEARNLPPSEVAETYNQLNRLLTAGDGAKLGPVERARLSEQILFQAAHPETIDQGLNSTCNVTTLETRAFERSPSSAARMITDVALTGKYVTPQGTIVDLERTGGLIPDKESMAALKQSFNHNWSDIKTDGSRSYASQIFENTAVNIHYADSVNGAELSRNGYQWQQGDVIQYKKEITPPGSKDSGERLVAYRPTPDGSYQEIPIEKAPALWTGELGPIYNKIVPSVDGNGAPINGLDSGFVVGGPTFAGDARVLSAGNPQDLGNILLNAQHNGKLPIVLYVDARDPVFLPPGQVGGAGGAHVVTVERVYWDGNVLRADVNNQWGLRNNKVGVDINDLFRSTLPRDVNGKIIPPNPQPLPPPIPLPVPPTPIASPTLPVAVPN